MTARTAFRPSLPWPVVVLVLAVGCAKKAPEPAAEVPAAVELAPSATPAAPTVPVQPPTPAVPRPAPRPRAQTWEEALLRSSEDGPSGTAEAIGWIRFKEGPL